MKRYENLYSYISKSLLGRYNINDDLFKIRLIKYLAYYISSAKALDDYILTLGDFNFSDVNKKISKKIRLVGLGGVGGNILTYFVKAGIFFDDLVVYESDDELVEFHNSLRYFVFNPYGLISKNELFRRFVNLFKRNDIVFMNNKYIPEENDEYIILGTPDVNTRRRIVELNLKYIFLFHYNNEFYLFSNMSKDFRKYEVSGVPIIEEYGIIELSSFFNGLIRNINKILEVIEK